jgi:hypothetical protein
MVVTFRKHRVRALLRGGQRCIMYGAAEFSRNIDLAVLANDGKPGVQSGSRKLTSRLY